MAKGPIEPLLTPEQFSELREAIERISGIVLGAGKLSHLDSVVRERMAQRGDADVKSYLARVAIDSSPGGERKSLVSALLVGETYFYRTPELYRALQRRLLPALHAGGLAFPLRIWSAGCSTGEEPYSIAIAALEAFGRKVPEPVRILASDLHAGFLEAAAEAAYPASALRDMPPILVSKYFTPLPDGRFRVAEEVRRLVRFEHRNLSDPARLPPVRERWAAIFCRNVMIYFGSDTTRRIVGEFHDRLVDGGLLVLGHSETLWGISEAFRLEEHEGVFCYRKQEDGAAPAPRRPADQPARRPAPPRNVPRAAPPVRSATPHPRPPSPASAKASLPAPAAPPPVAPAADAVALAMAQRAERTLDRDRPEEALAACLEALSLDPGCVEAEYLAAVSLRRMGRCEEALAHAARALLREPRFALAALEIAECQELLGRKKDAARQWESLLRMLEGPVRFPRLSPATGMSEAALRDYAASRAR